MTEQLARGIICHTALEELYDLSPENRTLLNLENLFRREWERLRGNRDNSTNSATMDENKKGYDVLFREDEGDPTTATYDLKAEIDWGRSALDLLRNYCELEDPTNANPLVREMWVHAKFPLENYTDENEYVVRGKIDRIDSVSNGNAGKLQLDIIDYKTGKMPNLKYSPAVNDRIVKEQSWKMRVYALMLWKMILATDEVSKLSGQQDKYKYVLPWTLQQKLIEAMNGADVKKWSNVLELNSLRLMYLTSHLDDTSANIDTNGRSIGRASYLDSHLGSLAEFQSMLDQTELEVQNIANGIKQLVDMQSPHEFKPCDWRYCSCHEIRRKFVKESVSQSPHQE